MRGREGELVVQFARPQNDDPIGDSSSATARNTIPSRLLTLKENCTSNDTRHDEKHLECGHDVERVEKLETSREPMRFHHDSEHHHKDDNPCERINELIVAFERFFEELCCALGKEAGLAVRVGGKVATFLSADEYLMKTYPPQMPPSAE